MWYFFATTATCVDRGDVPSNAFEAEPTTIRAQMSTNISDEAFFDALDLTHPGLEDVNAAVNNQDYDQAAIELAAYMRSRGRQTTSPKFYVDSDIPSELSSESVRASSAWMSVSDWDRGDNDETDFMNRFYWLHALRLAYEYTGDEKYADAFEVQANDWIGNVSFPQKNELTGDGYPKRFHSPWSPLSAGKRSQNFVVAYMAFAPVLDDDTHINILKSMLQHAQYLYLVNEECYYGREGDPSFINMQVDEMVGLAMIGTMFPEFKESRNWVDRAYDILYDHIEYNVYPDGVHKELTPRYHNAMLWNYFLAIRMAELNNLNISGFDMATYEKMFDFMLYTAEPDGKSPPIGDSENAQLDVFLVMGASLFERGDLKYLTREDFSTNLMLMGGDLILQRRVMERFQKLVPVEPTETSYAFGNAGFYVMRSDWTMDARYLLFKNGPWGGTHSHRDQLGIEVYAYGNRLIVDSGITDYSGSDVGYLRSTGAHNTVMVDHGEQPITSDYRVDEWTASDDYDFVDGTYDWGEGVTHRRKVFFVKPEYWIICDILEGNDDHDFYQLFHFLPTEIEIDPVYNSVRTNYDGANVLLVPADAQKLSVELFEKPVADDKGGSMTQHVYYKKSGKTVSFYTVIYPYKKGEHPEIDVTQLSVTENEKTLTPEQATGLKIEIEDYTDYFLISNTDTGSKKCEDIELDGKITYIRKDKAGTVVKTIEK